MKIAFAKISGRELWAGPTTLLTLVLAVFGDKLFFGPARVISTLDGDVFRQFYAWRVWGFGELRGGRFPGWNPHIYAGAPYFAGMQSALLYPPNWVHLFLPAWLAINWEMAINVYLTGLGTYCWCRGRGLKVLGATWAGAIAMLGGPHFLHAYAGHLSNLAAMAWIPFVYWRVDRVIQPSEPDRRRAIGTLALCVAMLVLAGHGQYLYYTFLTLPFYAWSRLTDNPEGLGQARWRPIASTALGVALGLALAAVQLVPTLLASRESVRNGGLPYAESAIFSLPPTQILTAITPMIFGPGGGEPYWGRWLFWEMNLFIGVTALVLLVHGAYQAKAPKRRRNLGFLCLFLLLAMGAYTPLFRPLYALLPGYNAFRGTSKWAFFALLFAAQLSGHGADRWLENRDGEKRLRILLSSLMVLAFATAALITLTSEGPFWRGAVSLAALAGEPQSYVHPSVYATAPFLDATANQAALSLCLAGATSLLGLVLVWRRSQSARWSVALVGLGLAELTVFGRTTLPAFDPNIARMAAVRDVLKPEASDDRVLDSICPNSALVTGIRNLLGDDPFILRRYAEFMAVVTGHTPESARQFLRVTRYSPLLRLLRCDKVLQASPDAGYSALSLPGKPLPHVLLTGKWTVVPGRDAILSALNRPGFDLDHHFLLEAPPEPGFTPYAGPVPGTARVISESANSLEVEAVTSRPALLIVTDLWSAGWSVHESPDSSGTPGAAQPADYVLRGVPLQPGRHHLLFIYSPPGLWTGVVVSLLALAVCSLLCVDRAKDRAKPDPAAPGLE